MANVTAMARAKASEADLAHEYPPGIVTCRDGEDVLAVIIRHTFRREGVSFFTPDHFPLQLGYMKHPAGWGIKAHLHNLAPRRIEATSEALFVRSGKVRVRLFTRDRRPAGEHVLEAGDIVLLVSGGHGFDFLEEAEMIEVKGGPYLGIDDKTYL